MTPSYADAGVSSALEAPALGGLSGAVSPGLESSGEGAAAAATPEAKAAAPAVEDGDGLQARTMTATAAGPAEGAQSAKFTPPDVPFNGAFTRTLPIEVPRFFELTPELSLEYDSGDTRIRSRDGFSMLGVGWHMTGGSSIERASAYGGVPGFVAGDIFVLDGNKLMACAGAAGSPSCLNGGTHTTRFETYTRIKQVGSGATGTWEVTV